MTPEYSYNALAVKEDKDFMQNKVSVTFRISETSRMTQKALSSAKGKNSITDLCYGINLLALREEKFCMIKYKAAPSDATDFLKYAKRAISTLLLVDAEKKEISLSHAQYNMFRLDDVQFIYANVLEENSYKTDSVYLLCEYLDDNNVVRKGNFIAKREWYEKLNTKEIPGCRKILCGFCKRKEVKVPAKVKYDKYSHSSYKVNTESTKKVTKLSVFTLQNISTNGVIVRNENEFLLYNELFRRNIPFDTLRKTTISGRNPQAVASVNGKKMYFEMVGEDYDMDTIKKCIDKTESVTCNYMLAKTGEDKQSVTIKKLF